jgi:hypothetical protein
VFFPYVYVWEHFAVTRAFAANGALAWWLMFLGKEFTYYCTAPPPASLAPFEPCMSELDLRSLAAHANFVHSLVCCGNCGRQGCIGKVTPSLRSGPCTAFTTPLRNTTSLLVH